MEQSHLFVGHIVLQITFKLQFEGQVKKMHITATQHTLNYVWIWRVNFGTLEVPGAQTGGIGRQIDMTKSSYIVPEPIFEGLMLCWVVPAKLACPPNSNVVQSETLVTYEPFAEHKNHLF